DQATNTIQSTVNLDVSAFVRMLAKIGYSYAVADQGLYPLAEVPVLPLIRGTGPDDGATWVGSSEYRLAVEERSPQHALGLIQTQRIVGGNSEKIWIARVKLFASLGATGYEVVVRRRRMP